MHGAISKKKLTIAMIGQKGLPVTENAGGIERHVEELASRLAFGGHRVVVYVRSHYGIRGVGMHKKVKLVRQPSIRTKHLDSITHAFLATLDALRRRVDVIHYHGVGPATLAWIPRLFTPSIKVVVTFHSVDRLHRKWGWFARQYLRFGEWAAIHFPHETIAVSQSLRQYCLDEYDALVHYIPNGAHVGPHPGSSELRRWGIKPGGYILAVARLVRVKGIHYLVQAYSRLTTDKKLVIAGASLEQSEYRDYLRHLSEGNSSIIFTGFQHGKALAQLFANAYLYVQPSEVEGLSVALLEAMAAGRCVLASDIPENMEPLDHSGVTFVNADVDDLEERLTELLNHPDLVEARGRKARTWVAKQYNWDDIARQTEKVYRESVH